MAIGDGNGGPSTTDGPAEAGASSSRAVGCPAWCDGQHEVDDHSTACHGRIVAQHDGVSLALSCVTYPGPAEPGSTVILLDMGATAGPAELEESDAIRLLGMLEASGDGPSWLAGTLRAALHLLDPDAGWIGQRGPR